MANLRLPKSPEIRVALLAAVIATTASALIGIASYLLFEQSQMQNVDHLLRQHAASVFASSDNPLPWAMLEPQFELVYPTDQRPATCIFWGRTDSQQYYRSKSWPIDTDPRTLIPSLKLPETWNKSRRSGRPSQASESTDGDNRGALGSQGFGSDLEEDAFEQALNPVRASIVHTTTHTWRMAAFLYDGDALVLGRNLDPVYSQLAGWRDALAASIPLCFLLVFGLTWLLSRRKQDGMAQIAAWLDQITADTITRRLNAGEYGTANEPLVKAFNDMMDRLEFSFEDARRFSGLAAHELKTPLAILQGKLDIAIHEQLPGSPWQQFLAALLEDVGRLKGVTEKLLLLSRADAGRLELNIVEVNLSELLQQHIEDTELLAPKLKLKVDVPENELINGDQTMLNLLLQNLFSNAIKHNSGTPDAFIHVDLQSIPNGIRLAISNSARPIPPELHQRVFSRFGRGAAAHKKEVEGAGLGLSLAYEIARVHGGRLKLKESTPEQTAFVLKLRRMPLPPPNVSTNWRLLKRVEPLSSHPV